MTAGGTSVLHLLMALVALLSPAALLATQPHLCGEDCGPLFASYPHNGSCWRDSTQSFFSFDVQPHYHVSDSCFGENDPCAPFYFNGTYHMMWQSHTNYVHVPAWNRLPAGQPGDTGISFGHAVSTDLAHWVQLENALWPDEWFTSVSVYDGSATIIDGLPIIVAAGLTPNTTSVFCHVRAVPTNLSDPHLEDWAWDPEPMYCGNATNNLTPFDAPSGAWRTEFKQWQYVDGKGNVFVSDNGREWRGALPVGGHQFPGGAVSDFFELPRICDGCGAASSVGAALPPTFRHYNGSDLACADIPGEDFKLPKGTDDGEGITQCARFCENHTECGGFVFVSGLPGTPTPGGPRCAIKGHGCCPGMQRGGVVSGIKPAECKHPSPPSPPGPPGPPPPRPPSPPTGPPTHVHEGGNKYQIVHLTPGTARDEAGTIATITDGGATVMSATSLGYLPRCDHGSFGFPKSFFDPVKKRRLQYGWVRGPGLQGEEDSTLGDTGLTLKNNHQSLLREVTYDPRLGILIFSPIEELALLRKQVLASVTKPTAVADGQVLRLPSPPHLANQSEIRLSFAMPTTTLSFGVRVMCSGEPSNDPEAPAFFEFGIDFTPANASAWTIRASGNALPLLATDKTIELVLYVDHTVVEAYYQGGRLALTSYVPQNLLLPSSAHTAQGVEIFAMGADVTVLNATMWRMDDIWDPITHNRPHQKPLVKTDDTEQHIRAEDTSWRMV